MASSQNGGEKESGRTRLAFTRGLIGCIESPGSLNHVSVLVFLERPSKMIKLSSNVTHIPESDETVIRVWERRVKGGRGTIPVEQGART